VVIQRKKEELHTWTNKSSVVPWAQISTEPSKAPASPAACRCSAAVAPAAALSAGVPTRPLPPFPASVPYLRTPSLCAAAAARALACTPLLPPLQQLHWPRSAAAGAAAGQAPPLLAGISQARVRTGWGEMPRFERIRVFWSFRYIIKGFLIF